MPYSPFSTRISGYLARELNLPQEQRTIMAYGLEGMVLSVLGLIMIMAVGYLLGAPRETFFAALSGGLLRKVSGGAHFSTPLKCLVTGAISYPLLGWLSHRLFHSYEISNTIVIIVCSLLSLLAVYLFAPVDSEAKPIVSSQFKRKLHTASILLVFFFVILALLYRGTSLGTAIMGGLTLQSFTLLPLLKAKNEGGAIL